MNGVKTSNSISNLLGWVTAIPFSHILLSEKKHKKGTLYHNAMYSIFDMYEIYIFDNKNVC